MSKLLYAAAVFSALATAGMMKQHEEHMTFVSADAAKKTVTLKGADGKESTGPMLNDMTMKAAMMLKPGDKVKVMCDDDDKGNHKGVSAVSMDK